MDRRIMEEQVPSSYQEKRTGALSYTGGLNRYNSVQSLAIKQMEI